MGQSKSKQPDSKSKHPNSTKPKRKQEIIHDQVYSMLKKFTSLEQEYYFERDCVFKVLENEETLYGTQRNQAYRHHTRSQSPPEQREVLSIAFETNFFISQIQDYPSIALISAFLRYLDFIQTSFPRFNSIVQSLSLIATRLHSLQLDMRSNQNIDGIQQLVKDRFTYISTFISSVYSHKPAMLQSEIGVLKTILLALQNNLDEGSEISQQVAHLEDISTTYQEEFYNRSNSNEGYADAFI